MPSSISPRPASNPTAQPYYGRFSDGRSAGATDVSVSFGLSGLAIDPGIGQPRLTWAYPTLKAGEPLRPNAIDVLLSTAQQPGASLFVQGREFASSLKTYAPHLTAKAERLRHARPWIFLAAAVIGLLTLVYAAGWSPIKSMAGVLPDSWRQRLGDEARRSMTESHQECSDAPGLHALAALTSRLSNAAKVSKPFRITVYDWDLMNAFAVPGGQIVMTKGLIEKAQSPDEVAGVLAHEMGHGIELHPETSIIRAVGLATAVELMMGGSGGALANMGVLLAQLGYTRSAEREADQHAVELLKVAGIAPQGLGDFFKRVAKIEGEDGSSSKTFKPFDLLRTHPPTAERAELVRRQGAYPSTPALDAQSWSDLKSICKTTIKPSRDAPQTAE